MSRKVVCWHGILKFQRMLQTLFSNGCSDIIKSSFVLYLPLSLDDKTLDFIYIVQIAGSKFEFVL